VSILPPAMTCGSVKRNTENHQKISRLESASVHLASRASFIAFLSGQETKKRGSAQICFSLWSRRSPKSRASHSGLQSSNWFFECEHQLLRETDGRNWAHWMQGKHGGERAGERRSCENAWRCSAYTQTSVSFFRIFSQGHWSRKIFHFISLSSFAPVRKRVGKALWTLIFSAH